MRMASVHMVDYVGQLKYGSIVVLMLRECCLKVAVMACIVLYRVLLYGLR